MSDLPTEELRASINQWVKQALKESNPAGWFETLYTHAAGDEFRVPWAMQKPNPYLVEWLASQSQRQGKALVVGCGLGDDAEAIANQGLEVTAFDISPTAIAWCQKRFPNSVVNYLTADLFSLEPTWKEAFALVYSSRTIQSLPLNVRSQAISALVSPTAPGGTLVVITQQRKNAAEPDGPPWPLSEAEIDQFKDLGLAETHRRICDSNAYPTVLLEYRRGNTTIPTPESADKLPAPLQ